MCNEKKIICVNAAAPARRSLHSQVISSLLSSKTLLISGTLLLVSSFLSSVYADGNTSTKYPAVNYSDVVFTDKSRQQDGTICNSCTPVNGYRLIDVRIYRPALSPGHGNPFKIPAVPLLFSGAHPQVPTSSSTVSYQTLKTWTDNTPVSKSMPLVLLFGAGAKSVNALLMAEQIAAAGYIVVVPTGYGVDTSTCPQCGPAVPNTYPRDARVVITAAISNLLGFSGGLIKTDQQGVPIAGCVGGSAGGAICLEATSGASVADANSLPGELNADLRIHSVFSGDEGISADVNSVNYSPRFNNVNFKVPLAMYGSIVYGNWPSIYPFYFNSPLKIFYDLTSVPHIANADLGTTTCLHFSEDIRVLQQGVNTPFDDLEIAGLLGLLTLAPDFASCPSQYSAGFSVLPAIPPSSTLPSNLSSLQPFVPLSGIFVDPVGDFTQMSNFYVVQFLNATLNHNSSALQTASSNLFPQFIDNVYVNAVPGFKENDFNVHNTQIDFTLDATGKHYLAKLSPYAGPIPDPSSNFGAYSLFGNHFWNDQPITVFPLAFGSFPFPKGNLIASTASLDIQSSGFILPESSLGSIDGEYAPRRLKHWFEDRGSWTVACGTSDMLGFPGINPANPHSGQVWVENTPKFFRVTWYQVASFEFLNDTGFISEQCTLFPDGHIQIVEDNSIPVPLNATTGETGAMLVGISSGRLHVNQYGVYDPSIQPKIITFTDIMNGVSQVNADAIFEQYSEGRKAIGNVCPQNNNAQGNCNQNP